ncbi:hypothetical protein B0H21DRAFT_290432 [Amylocystis lapponica]|nr:hypothetical protein B0H21DRAFT_290432 [Amylocystis lapponica]
MTHKFHPPPLEPFIPLVSSTMMVSHRESQAPCGPDCFLSIKEDSMDIVDFAQSELEILDGILRLFPDILPCTLAYLCKISCYKIYVERCFLYNDADITANAGLPHKSRDLPSEFEDDGTNKVQNHLRFTPVDFCSHPGPCDKHAGCVCFQRNQHCKRSCRCSLKCRLRRKGCRCGQNKCSDSCPCLRAGWECDPEVCLVKKTRVKPSRRETQRAPNMTRHQCQNMKFQRAQHYQLEVKTGSYGLGTFAVRAIPKNKYIGEYVSEYMDNTAEGPGVIHKHRRMNYLFELNSTWCLDAAFLGNETRYINHPPNADDTNVVADVKLVNGEHRIAFISLKAIKAGAELLLDYGLAYWKDHA